MRSWPWLHFLILRAWAAISWKPPLVQKAPGGRASETDVALFVLRRSCVWESIMFSAWRCQASSQSKYYQQKVASHEARSSLLLARFTQICFTSWQYGTSSSSSRRKAEVNAEKNRICELESQVQVLLQQLHQSEQRVKEVAAESLKSGRRAEEAEHQMQLKEVKRVFIRSPQLSVVSSCSRILEQHALSFARWCLGTWHCVAAMQRALRAHQNAVKCDAVALDEARAALELADVKQREAAKLAEVGTWERAVASIAEAECSMQDSLGGTFDSQNQNFRTHLNEAAAVLAADEISACREAVREAIASADEARTCRGELNDVLKEVHAKAGRESHELEACKRFLQRAQKDLEQSEAMRRHAEQEALSLERDRSAQSAWEHAAELEMQSRAREVQGLQSELHKSADQVRVAETQSAKADMEIVRLRKTLAHLQNANLQNAHFAHLSKVAGDTNFHPESNVMEVASRLAVEERRQNTETLRRRARQWIRRISSALEAGQKFRLLQSCYVAWSFEHIRAMRIERLEEVPTSPSKAPPGILWQENQRFRRRSAVQFQVAASFSGRARTDMLARLTQAIWAVWRSAADLSIATRRGAAARDLAQAWEHEEQDLCEAATQVAMLSERLALAEASQRNELELEAFRGLQYHEMEAAISEHRANAEASQRNELELEAFRVMEAAISEHRANAEASISEQLVYAGRSEQLECQIAQQQGFYLDCIQSKNHLAKSVTNRICGQLRVATLTMILGAWKSRTDCSMLQRRQWPDGNCRDVVYQPNHFHAGQTPADEELSRPTSPTPSFSNLPPVEMGLLEFSAARATVAKVLEDSREISSLLLSEETDNASPWGRTAAVNQATSPLAPMPEHRLEASAIESLAFQMRQLATWVDEGEAFRAQVVFLSWQRLCRHRRGRLVSAAARASYVQRFSIVVLQAILMAWLHIVVESKYSRTQSGLPAQASRSTHALPHGGKHGATLRDAWRKALVTFRLHTVLVAWGRLASCKRNARAVTIAMRGRIAADSVAIACTVLSQWRCYVLQTTALILRIQQREAIRRTARMVCSLHQPRLAPGMLLALLALWRQRARTTGLMTWRWRCCRLALLRAMLDAWHLTSIDLQSCRASTTSAESSLAGASYRGGVTASSSQRVAFVSALPSQLQESGIHSISTAAASSRRGPAIRHASRLRSAAPQQSTTLSAAARKCISPTSTGYSADEVARHRHGASSHSPQRSAAKSSARRSSSAGPKFTGRRARKDNVEEEPLVSHVSILDLQPRVSIFDLPLSTGALRTKPSSST